jgi:hypothetical protein
VVEKHERTGRETSGQGEPRVAVSAMVAAEFTQRRTEQLQHDLDIKNKCLLSKWFFKLLSEEGVWQELLSNKYLGSKSLLQVQVKPTDSPFWKGIMRVKDDFFRRGSFVVRDGMKTRF